MNKINEFLKINRMNIVWSFLIYFFLALLIGSIKKMVNLGTYWLMVIIGAILILIIGFLLTIFIGNKD
jgi:hypothetical protein